MADNRLDVSKYLSVDKDKRVVCLAPEMRAWIAKAHFDNNVAKEFSDKIMCVGDFPVWFAAEAEGGKGVDARMDLGVVVGISFSSKTMVEKRIDPNGEPERCWELTIKRGEPFMETITHVQDHESARFFLHYFNLAKLPSDMPYKEIPERLKRNFAVNGVSTGLSSVVVEAIVSEMMRDGKDPKVPFRRTAGRTGADTGYSPAKLKDLPGLNSTFGGLSSERIKDQIQMGILSEREGKTSQTTPLEKVMLS